MTALLALENAELGDAVTASTNASGVPGTSIYLSVGEVLRKSLQPARNKVASKTIVIRMILDFMIRRY